jgi:hypothetical protein
MQYLRGAENSSTMSLSTWYWKHVVQRKCRVGQWDADQLYYMSAELPWDEKLNNI